MTDGRTPPLAIAGGKCRRLPFADSTPAFVFMARDCVTDQLPVHPIVHAERGIPFIPTLPANANEHKRCTRRTLPWVVDWGWFIGGFDIAGPANRVDPWQRGASDGFWYIAI
jgi:hypothetical protein